MSNAIPSTLSSGSILGSLWKHERVWLATAFILALTWEVRDGILNHTGPVTPITLEGQVVKIADRVAYINHDIDDALRGDILELNQLPEHCLNLLGREHSKRINNMIMDLIHSNQGRQSIQMSPGVQRATDDLRNFLFRHVYIGSEAKREEQKARHVVQYLFRHLHDNPTMMPLEYQRRADKIGMERAVCDYIAGMTDRYAIAQFEKLFIPRAFSIPE